MTGFFDGFAIETIELPTGRIRLRRGGSGPPMLLLHGMPQSSAMWHAVAPALARRFTVIAPDLRGYGGSHKPQATDDHAPYSKREMAAEMAAVMVHFGFERFDVASHDRGARVAHRMAIDLPDRVARLAVLDIVPTIEHFERADMAFALGYYHWFWLAQRHPFPESLIDAAPDAWFEAHTGRGLRIAARPTFHPDARAEYVAAAHDPAAIRGMCEDYRAAAAIDLEHDRASRSEGRRIACPLLVLWGARGGIARWYDALDIWRRYADGDVSGAPIDSGHYLAEEAPDAVVDHFARFFG